MAQAPWRAPPSGDVALAIALFERGEAETAARLCRAALAREPRQSAARIVLASALLATHNLAAALAEADAVLGVDPAASLAHFIRGTALHELRRSSEAAAALQRAVALAPGDAKAWLNFGVTLTSLDRLDDAERALRRACALAPRLAEAHASLGTLLTQRLRLPEAAAAYRRALRLRPDFVSAQWDLGATLLRAGDFVGGWAAMRQRKPEEDAALARRGVAGEEWDGTGLAGGTLLACSAQGLGDAIQMARYLPLLAARGIRVVLACHTELARLLKTADGVAAVATPADTLPRHDAWVALSSLPRLFATSEKTVPSATGYLAAKPSRVAHWRAALPTGPTVGLVWAGNRAHENDARRSMPPAALAPLLAVSGVHFVSLQRDAGGLPPGVTDLAPHLTDLAETAAVVQALDLVVTVDTAIAHLAGALGCPAWVALPHAADWRWLLGHTDSPWYASVRLFRQPSPGDWQIVAASVAAALPGALPGRQARPCSVRGHSESVLVPAA